MAPARRALGVHRCPLRKLGGHHRRWPTGQLQGGAASRLRLTGIRLEAMEDPSLPGGNGPGLFPRNGNFVLSELVRGCCARTVDADVVRRRPDGLADRWQPNAQAQDPHQ